MSVPTEEAVRPLDLASGPFAEYPVPETGSGHLDFIPDDPDELRHAVARMAAQINFADWRFVKLIAAMDRTRGWREGGYCSLGNWLDHRCGLGPCASRERIRIGRALARLPRIDAAFRDGVISYSKVRAVTRVATPRTEAMLLAIAEGGSAARLESLVRTHERVGAGLRGSAGSEQRRSLSWHYEDGMLVITAAVPAERGALVINALQRVVDGKRDEGEARAASLLGVAWLAEDGEDAPSRNERAVADVSTEKPADPAGEDNGEAVSARAASADVTDVDAAGDVSAETPANGAGGDSGKVVSTQIASAYGTDLDAPGDVSAETPADRAQGVSGEAVSARAESAALPDPDAVNDVSAETDGFPDWLTFDLSSREQRYADALVDIAEHYLASGGGALKRRRSGRRYEVVLTIGRNELVARQSECDARYQVEPDWGIDEEDARQIACDTDLTEYIEDARGDLLNYERRRRIVPGRLLRALKLRDRNRCRFPGCAHPRYLEAHHVRHWIDGGETCLDNLVLLCGAHHRLLHHGAFHIAVEDDGVVFVSRDGEVIEPALRPQFGDVSAEALPMPAGPDVPDQPPATRHRRRPVLKAHSDRVISDMLRFREDWGRQRNARFRRELEKISLRNLGAFSRASFPNR